jgi:hypothetical protein
MIKVVLVFMRFPLVGSSGVAKRNSDGPMTAACQEH